MPASVTASQVRMIPALTETDQPREADFTALEESMRESAPKKHSQQVNQHLDTPMSYQTVPLKGPPNAAGRHAAHLLYLVLTVSPLQPICLAKEVTWRVDNTESTVPCCRHSVCSWASWFSGLNV